MKFTEIKDGFTTMGSIILVLIILLIIILSTGCTKDKGCRFYTKGQLYLEPRTGECYYLENGSKQYLEKEQCANYCE
jgi:hypothetical protein